MFRLGGDTRFSSWTGVVGASSSSGVVPPSSSPPILTLLLDAVTREICGVYTGGLEVSDRFLSKKLARRESRLMLTESKVIHTTLFMKLIDFINTKK